MIFILVNVKAYRNAIIFKQIRCYLLLIQNYACELFSYFSIATFYQNYNVKIWPESVNNRRCNMRNEEFNLASNEFTCTM